MALDTHSDHRIRVDGVEVATRDELTRLGLHAARQRPAHETKKFRKDQTPVPREAKVGFAIGAGILVICCVALVGKAIANRSSAPVGGGTTAPAITKPAPAPAPEPQGN